MSKKRLIAFYLPQFHPIPENDEWWGTDFTEWTNVRKAKPLFWKHEQPKVPADLGYYDLRDADTRIAQAKLAKEAEIEGFCYWHYWFGNGKTLLERPFNEVLASGKPDLPFCLGWANHSWEKKTWQPGNNNTLLIEQTYNGIDDHTAHFYSVLEAFKDERYIRVNNKPLFLIWSPENLPDNRGFIELWNKLAIENGLEGIYFIAYSILTKETHELLEMGYDSVSVDLLNECFMHRKIYKRIAYRILRYLFSIPRILSYDEYINYFVKNFKLNSCLPVIIPNFDHSPRSGKRGIVLKNCSPKKFKKLLTFLVHNSQISSDDDSIIFIKSWNEWGEGNYLEPDSKYGKKYLLAIKNIQNKN